MKTGQLLSYKAALERKLADLQSSSRKRADIEIEKRPDVLDEVQLLAERELAVTSLSMDSGLIRRVSAALLRIEDHSYGICIECEEEIKPGRLNAVPWAELCIRCQTNAERSGGQTVELAAPSTDESLYQARRRAA